MKYVIIKRTHPTLKYYCVDNSVSLYNVAKDIENTLKNTITKNVFSRNIPFYNLNINYNFETQKINIILTILI